MIDFRDHLISIIAVFLALGIGMLVGSAVSGNEVLSEKQAVVVADLRREYGALRAREKALTQRVMLLEEQARADDAFATGILPVVVEGRLAGMEVAVVSTRADRPDGYTRPVADALSAAGAEVRVIPAGLPESTERGEVAAAGETLAATVLAGGPLPPQAVIFLAHPGDRAQQVEPFLRAATGYWRRQGLRVVAAESRDTSPSLVPSYRRLDLSSVDDADQPSGRVGVVLLLSGASGHYGVKPTAQAVIPRLAPAEGANP